MATAQIYIKDRERGRDSQFFRAHLCSLLITTAVCRSLTHLPAPHRSLHSPLLQSTKFPRRETMVRLVRKLSQRLCTREEELVGTRCSPRLSETSLRPTTGDDNPRRTTVGRLAAPATSILHTNNHSCRHRLLSPRPLKRGHLRTPPEFFNFDLTNSSDDGSIIPRGIGNNDIGSFHEGD